MVQTEYPFHEALIEKLNQGREIFILDSNLSTIMDNLAKEYKALITEFDQLRALRDAVGWRETNIHKMLNEFVGFYETQEKAAFALDISPQYLCDLLAKRRDISEQVALRLGYEKITIYKQKFPAPPTPSQLAAYQQKDVK